MGQLNNAPRIRRPVGFRFDLGYVSCAAHPCGVPFFTISREDLEPLYAEACSANLVPTEHANAAIEAIHAALRSCVRCGCLRRPSNEP
jgi:L-asparaginase II